MEDKENVENMHINPRGRLPAVLAEFDIEGIDVPPASASTPQLNPLPPPSVETRCEALRSQARELEASFRNQLILETLKIPREVRSMPMKTFAEHYSGDLNAIIEEALRKRYEPLPSAATTSSSSSAQSQQHS
jgi:hypothetical protein